MVTTRFLRLTVRLFDHGMSLDFADWAWHMFHENGEDDEKYLILVEQDHVAGYRNSLGACGGQKKSNAWGGSECR